MKIGGFRTQWLFAREFKEGQKLDGAFMGIGKLEKNGKSNEYAVFVSKEGEFNIWPNLLTGAELEINGSSTIPATLTKTGNSFFVELK